MTDRRAFYRLLLTLCVSCTAALAGLSYGITAPMGPVQPHLQRLPPLFGTPDRGEPLLIDAEATVVPLDETSGPEISSHEPPAQSILNPDSTAPADRPVAQHSAYDQREISVASQRAQQHAQQGFSLAARGALFSARNEFIRALRVVADVLDAQSTSRQHATALSEGLRALKEAEDFMTGAAEDELNIDVATVVSGHRTDICKATRADENTATRVSARQALDRYYRHAHQQLTAAASAAPIASTALFGLGKVHASLADLRPADREIQEYRAMALYQAALAVNPANPSAANELGVLLARYGRHDAAQQLLQQSLAVRNDRTVWSNLSVVMSNLGQRELARQALARAGKARSASGIPLQRVQWLDKAAFAAMRRPDEAAWPAVAGQTAPAATTGYQRSLQVAPRPSNRR
ncbi:MAG: hypothetical protein OES79_07155 [Planctomycetota bacterium]|nr:hypothetical protein [Planctomycetota bacterium]